MRRKPVPSRAATSRPQRHSETLEPRRLLAVVPVGDEFEVGPPEEVQAMPAVGLDPDGDFAVTWTKYDSLANTDADVRLQRFGADGAVRGGVTDAATGTSRQDSSAVAFDAAGNSVVAWADHGATTAGVYARRYDANGAPRGDVITVFTPGADGADVLFSTHVEIASDAAGGFVVVWGATYSDARGAEVLARRFDATGAPAGAPFRASRASTGSQTGADVAMDPAGDFVITWANNPDDQGESVVGQRFNAAGARVGGEFPVSATPAFWGVGQTSVDTDDAGNFVVAWTDARGENGEIKHVLARRYGAAGAALGDPFQVDDVVSPEQSRTVAAVAVDADGDFMVVWLEFVADDGDVYARQFKADGTAEGPGARVNTTQEGHVLSASAAAGTNTFVVTWLNQSEDLDAYRVRGQRFAGTGPPPAGVTAAYVNGSAWVGAFRTYLEAQGLGSAAAGYSIPLGTEGDVLPWVNMDRLVLVFNREVDLQPSDLLITGVRSDYTATAVAPVAGVPNAYAFTLDRNLGDLPGGGNNGDLLLVKLADRVGVPFSQRIDVLQGDVNRTGSVVATDFSEVKVRFFRSTTAPGSGTSAYTPFHDVDGSGAITAADFSAVKQRFFDILPEGAPTGAAALGVGEGITSALRRPDTPGQA
jgi:hypothetical protein